MGCNAMSSWGIGLRQGFGTTRGARGDPISNCKANKAGDFKQTSVCNFKEFIPLSAHGCFESHLGIIVAFQTRSRESSSWARDSPLLSALIILENLLTSDFSKSLEVCFNTLMVKGTSTHKIGSILFWRMSKIGSRFSTIATTAISTSKLRIPK